MTNATYLEKKSFLNKENYDIIDHFHNNFDYRRYSTIKSVCTICTTYNVRPGNTKSVCKN